MNLKLYLNRNWKFTDNFEGSLLIEPMSEGQIVELPHTFSETSYNYINPEKLRALCVYQRTFFAKNEWRGKRMTLTFEGVARKASVYINGVNRVIHENASTPFEAEIGSKVNFGEENLITVIVDSREETEDKGKNGVEGFIDEPPFGGIYREVYLTIKEQISIENVFYKAETTLPPDTRGMNKQKLSEYKIPGRISSKIKLSEAAIRMAKEHRLRVRQYLNETEIAYQPLSETGETVTSTGPVQIWDLDSPTCYRIQTDLIFDDEVIDTDVSLVGFRTAAFDQSGFYLNGRKVKIRGVVRHQSFPYVGYAMPESIQRYEARIIKEELHFNGVRVFGGYPSSHFLDECDKRGILVFCEAPIYKASGAEVLKTHLQTIEEMITFGRNHPSIFLWGTRAGNLASTELDKQAVALAHRLDPTRATAGDRLEREMNFFEDVYSYTDLSFDGKGSPLLSKEEVTSDMSRPYLVSGYLGESLPVRPTDSPRRKAKQIMYAASVLDGQAFLDDVCGSFVLSMCDHISEAENAAEDGIVYHGIMDCFRNKKPVAAVYSTQNNSEPEIMVYPPLSGDRERWEGFGEVYIITNTDSVRVYRDDEFICEYFKSDSPFGHMRHGPIIMSDFLGEVFSGDDMKNDQAKRIKKLLNQMAVGGISSFIQPGQMMDRIMGRIIYRMNRRQLMDLYESYVSKSHVYKFEGIKNGAIVVSTKLKPASGKYLRVDASAKNLIERHGYDVVSIRIVVSNEAGEVLNNYNEPLIVNTRGPVKLIGPGIVPLRGGMAGTYIRSTGEEGEAEVLISSGDLVPKKLSFNILRAPEEEI